MTVIIGFTDKKNKITYMGSDRCISSSTQRFTLGMSKIYQPSENPNFLLGFAGDPRVSQLVTAFMKFPKEDTIKSEGMTIDYGYLIRSVIPCIQNILLENKYADNTLKMSVILFAYKDKLWSIGNNFQVLENEDDYLSIGSGGMSANAVLETMNMLDTDMDIVEKIISALKVSTKLAVGVEGPYDLFGTGRGKMSNEALNNIIGASYANKVIHSINNNYIKKVLEKGVRMSDVVESETTVFLTEDRKDIYFIDINGRVCVLKSNGDIIYDIKCNDNLTNKEWSIVELNNKGIKLLELVKDNISFEVKTEEES